MNDIEKDIIQLTDEEKKKRLEYETNPYYIKILIMHLEKDEDKVSMQDKLIEKYKEERYKEARYKIERYKIDIWCSLQSDDLKLELLETMENSDDLGTLFNKAKLIKTIQDDDKKILAMKQHIRNSTFRLEIMQTLQSNQKKIHNLFLITDDFEKKTLLEELKIETDEQRWEVAKVFKADNNKFIYIREMNEENREKSLELVTDNAVKKDIILTLSQEKRLEHIEAISANSFQYKEEIVDSVKNDEIKKKYLEKAEDKEVITKVLMCIEDDTYKLEQIEELVEEESNRALVITSLKDDETKLRELNKLLDKDNQTIVKMSCQDTKVLRKNFLKRKRRYRQIGLDKEITIGIEIETEGERAETLRKLKHFLKRQGKPTRRWETKGEMSLSNEDGLEVVSPVLTDTKEDVEEIYMTCEMLKQVGQEANEKCGAHVHIGADYLKSKQAYVNLLEMWGNTERIMYIISNEPQSIPRGVTSTHAEPISYKFNRAIEEESIKLREEEDLKAFIPELQRVQGNKERGLNLLNINHEKNTIEFRIANGTINPDVWIENIRLFGRIVQKSQELAEIQEKGSITEEEKKRLELMEALKKDILDKEKLEILLEILFEEEEKEIYRKRYLENDRILRYYQYENFPFIDRDFQKVDFKHKKGEFHEIAIQERYSEVAEAMRETTEYLTQRYRNNEEKRGEEK